MWTFPVECSCQLSLFLLLDWLARTCLPEPYVAQYLQVSTRPSTCRSVHDSVPAGQYMTRGRQISARPSTCRSVHDAIPAGRYRTQYLVPAVSTRPSTCKSVHYPVPAGRYMTQYLAPAVSTWPSTYRSVQGKTQFLQVSTRPSTS